MLSLTLTLLVLKKDLIAISFVITLCVAAGRGGEAGAEVRFISSNVVARGVRLVVV